MVPEARFRPVGGDDWPAIFDVFTAVTATGDTYPYPPGLSAGEARAVWMAPGHTVFVATVGDEIVGTAYLRQNMGGLADHVANAGWMIHPDQQGRGIGRSFGEYVLDRAREAGFEAMQFNAVVATNTSAVALWESLGFEIVGTVPDAFRHATAGRVPVHIMYRKL